MQYGLHRFPNITPSNIFMIFASIIYKITGNILLLLRTPDFVIILIGSSCH